MDGLFKKLKDEIRKLPQAKQDDLKRPAMGEINGSDIEEDDEEEDDEEEDDEDDEVAGSWLSSFFRKIRTS
jgi:hypothetical protein